MPGCHTLTPGKGQWFIETVARPKWDGLPTYLLNSKGTLLTQETLCWHLLHILDSVMEWLSACTNQLACLCVSLSCYGEDIVGFKYAGKWWFCNLGMPLWPWGQGRGVWALRRGTGRGRLLWWERSLSGPPPMRCGCWWMLWKESQLELVAHQECQHGLMTNALNLSPRCNVWGNISE